VALQRLGETRVAFFACLDTDSFSARCQNREEHSPLAMHTAAFLHALVMLAAGLALCYEVSINLTFKTFVARSNIMVTSGAHKILVRALAAPR
jgi:hypothetical protein